MIERHIIFPAQSTFDSFRATWYNYVCVYNIGTEVVKIG